MVHHRRPSYAGPALAARVTVVSVAATAAAALSVVPVRAAPERPADRVAAAAQVDRLRAAAERAVEAYNGAAERVAELEVEVERRRDRVATGQEAVNAKRRLLGSAAAAHYRAGGLDPSLALMLSPDPDSYLSRAATLDRLADRQSGELRDLLATQRTLEKRRAEATAALAELAEKRAELEHTKDAVQRRLAAARRHYQRLTAQQRAARERAARRDAHPALTAAAQGAPPEATSARAALAVAAARQAVGLPYAWGQAGPRAFDCSGLTQWAYAQAGIDLPRTSQAQAGAGHRIGMDQARPGDLVVYRDDASHVAMYVGHGQIVHAPYPGSLVRYDTVGILPVHSVVRP